MIINEEENVWTHPQLTDRHASEFFGMRAEYDGTDKKYDFLRPDFPGNKGRQVRIRIPKSCISKHGQVHIMPFLKQHLGFFAEDINTNWVLTGDSEMLPDPMDY